MNKCIFLIRIIESVLDRGGAEAQRLLQRLTGVDSTQIAASIISYEEQMRGWLSYAAIAQTVEKQLCCILTAKATINKLLRDSNR